MANIQVKNVADSLHRRLRRFARKHNRTLGDVVTEAIERQLARGEFLDRLTKRSRTPMKVSAASLLREEREGRDEEMTK